MESLKQLIKSFAIRLAATLPSPNIVIIAIVTEEGIIVIAPPKLAPKLGELIENEISPNNLDKHLLN